MPLYKYIMAECKYSLKVSRYLALSFFPPKRAAAAFLKKLFAGLETWKSGAL